MPFHIPIAPCFFSASTYTVLYFLLSLQRFRHLRAETETLILPLGMTSYILAHSTWYHYWFFLWFFCSVFCLYFYLFVYLFLISWRLHYWVFLKKEGKREKDRRKEGEYKGKEIRKREDEGRKAEITLDENKGHLYRIESEPRDNHSKN